MRASPGSNWSIRGINLRLEISHAAVTKLFAALPTPYRCLALKCLLQVRIYLGQVVSAAVQYSPTLSESGLNTPLYRVRVIGAAVQHGQALSKSGLMTFIGVRSAVS